MVARIGYDSEADTANPTGSVFCAHGAGFVVPWDQVPDYMHLDYVYTPDGEKPEDGIFYDTADQTFGPGGTFAVKKPNEAKSQTSTDLRRKLREQRAAYEELLGLSGAILAALCVRCGDGATLRLPKQAVHDALERYEFAAAADGEDYVLSYRERAT